MQLARRPVELVQLDVLNAYESLLLALKETAVGRGEFRILDPRPAWDGNPSGQNFIVVQWQTKAEEFDLVVVNLAPHPSQCRVNPAIAGLEARDWRVRDLLGEGRFERRGAELAGNGLFLELPENGAQLLRFRSAV